MRLAGELLLRVPDHPHLRGGGGRLFQVRGTASRVSVAPSPSLRNTPPQHGQAKGAGYKDLIDHDVLRFLSVLTAVLDKPTGELSGKPMLNRLDHAALDSLIAPWWMGCGAWAPLHSFILPAAPVLRLGTASKASMVALRNPYIIDARSLRYIAR